MKTLIESVSKAVTLWYLKTDMQGFDYQALLAAGPLVASRAQYVLTEVWWNRYQSYAGQENDFCLHQSGAPASRRRFVVSSDVLAPDRPRPPRVADGRSAPRPRRRRDKPDDPRRGRGGATIKDDPRRGRDSSTDDPRRDGGGAASRRRTIRAAAAATPR